MTPEELTGRTDKHTVLVPAWDVRVHKEAEESLREITDAASIAGFTFFPCSAFRDFNTQLRIWNAKVRGERPVLDVKGNPLDVKKLKSEEVIHAILRWSALPGASRHHWGTDLDVIDKSAVRSNYQVQLVPEEFSKGGPFERLHLWLDSNLSRFDFFRPYAKDTGGIAPERWHLSFRPIAKQCENRLTVDLIRQVIATSEIELKADILRLLPYIYSRYVKL